MDLGFDMLSEMPAIIAALTAYQLNPIQPNSPSALQLP
jgi:hypothetical protein